MNKMNNSLCQRFMQGHTRGEYYLAYYAVVFNMKIVSKLCTESFADFCSLLRWL